MFYWSVLSLSEAAVGILSVIPAYIDPNTGGMLFQILAVLFGVISGALLLFSGKIKGFYYRIRRQVKNPEVDFVDETDNQEGDESQSTGINK
jgi:hypothetical protein